MFDAQVYSNRRNKLKSLMGSGLIILPGNVDAPMNYPDNIYKFRQDSSFLYFFGLDMPGLNAIIDCDSGEEIIFGNELTIDDIIWMGNQPKLIDLAAKCDVSKVQPFAQFATRVAESMNSKQKIHILPPYRGETKILLSEVLGCMPAHVSEFISEPLIKACVEIRSVKEPWEIVEIENVMEVAYLMHTTAMWMAQPGAKEYEISGALEGIALGANGNISFPIILTKDGQTLHNHNHHNTLRKGDLMIVDAGFESHMHYATDHTRTTPVGGKFSQRQKDIYQLVLDANNAATALAAPDVLFRDCHLLAAKTIATGLKDLGLMKGNIDDAVAAGAHALFFPHGLGHHMGLDVHDMEGYGEDYVGYDDTIKRSTQFGTRNLRMGKALKENYVMTNEPGGYFIPELIDLWQAEKKHADFINYDKVNSYREFGGIRLEDDILITADGARNLGKRIPITIEEVEEVASGKNID